MLMASNSGLYIYCIISDQEETDMISTEEVQTDKNKLADFRFGNTGVRNQPVYKIGYKDLYGVVSNFSLKQLKVNIDDVVAHQNVVETIRNKIGITTLPVRFGTILKSQQEVVNLLSRSYNEYKLKLIKFNGKNEFGIKVLVTNTTKERIKDLVENESEQIKRIKNSISSLSAGKSGSDYLLKLSLNDAIKNEIYKKIEALALEIHEQFRGISSDATLLKADTEQIILNAAYLVDQNNATAFEQKVMELKKKYASANLIFHMSGAWAPYSFC